MSNPDIVNMLPYRRSAAVMMLIGIATIGLWVASLSDIATAIGSPLTIAGLSLVLASILANIAMLLLRRFRAISTVTFAAYMSLLAGFVCLYGPLGQVAPLLVVPWTLALFVASRWSWRGIIAALAAGLGIITWHNLQDFSLVQLLTAAAASLVPIGAAILQFYNRQTDTHEDTLHLLAQELSQVSNKSDIVINAIGEGVVAIDNKGIIQLVNPSAEDLTGWTNFDALGLGYETVLKFIDDKGNIATGNSNPIQAVLHGGTPVNRSDLRLVTNSGKKLHVSLLVSPIGKFGNGAIIVFRDITREVAENREQVEFISTASHEMRTPVAAIEGYISLAINPQTATVDERARGYLIKAHESAAHLGRLFQDLLDVSRAEDGRLKNEPKVFDATDFLRESYAMLLHHATEKGLSLHFTPDIPQDPEVQPQTPSLSPTTYVYVDPDHLREVISNLIENAIKYTKQGGISVNVTTENDKVVISVSDTGIGLTPEDIPHLFQKFYRIDSSDTREIGGTGLGLYLCRRLVESMDGHIWVESELGKGSTFYVSLNRIDNAKATELMQQPPAI